jgi:hypothetical protein
METPFIEKDLNSFEEIDALLFNIRRRRPKKTIFFRGQSESVWGLTPSLFREVLQLQEIPADFVQTCVKNEMQNVRHFVRIADDIGFNLPGSYMKLLNSYKKFKIDYDDWYHLNKNDYIELITISQHHGIPTRFLDFTSEPLIALFFAAEEAAKKQLGMMPKEPLSEEKFSLWIIDAFYLFQPECRIITAHAPTARNKYLNAQKGLFITYDLQSEDDFKGKSKEYFNLKKIVEENCHEIAKLGEGAKEIWPVIQKYNFPFEHSFDILRKLDSRNINLTSIKPSLDNIRLYIDFTNNINRAWANVAKRLGYYNKDFYF